MRHARDVLRSSVCVINDTDSRKLGVLGCVAATYSVKQTNLKKKKEKQNCWTPSESCRFSSVLS